MSAQKMLEQLLKSGLSMVDDNKGRGSRRGYGGDRKPDADWARMGSGGAAGGLLGMLIGSKRGRGMGGTALKVGSVAALGAAAYKAYSHWQAQQASQNTSPPPATQTTTPRTMASTPPAASEAHSRALLMAMISAAKSDGHLDDRELGLIHAELEKLEAEPPLRQWMEDELRKPLDPAEVARAASTPELAAEMYFTSLLVVDGTAFMERAYLDELARQLKLEPGLKAELETRARPY